jgi:hypothetical protein
VHCKSDLLEIVGTFESLGGHASVLNGREKQTGEHADDGDHYQELEKHDAAALMFHGGLENDRLHFTPE